MSPEEFADLTDAAQDQVKAADAFDTLSKVAARAGVLGLVAHYEGQRDGHSNAGVMVAKRLAKYAPPAK